MDRIKTDVLVIGSGPAGNTAAIYTARSMLSTTMITGVMAGGQLTVTTEVANFPGFENPIYGSDLMGRIIKQSENLGVKVEYDTVARVNLEKRPFVCETEMGKIYESEFLVIATGASPKWLGIPSEMKYVGHGVSSCATCDGMFFQGRDVMVVGGGDSAAIEALHLSHMANRVYLVHRRDSLRMKHSYQKEIKNNHKIEVILDSEVQEIFGDNEPKKVKGVQLYNNKVQATMELNVEGVFISIGKNPNTMLFRDSGLQINDSGYIVTKPDSSRTNLDGVYVVGDVTDKKFKQAVVAAGYGAIAGLEISEDAGAREV